MTKLSLLAELHEIEDVTDINGCFLLDVSDHKIIESTIPLSINESILWEVSVLRDTFQQFSSGLNHGKLKEIMLKGTKGFIILYRLNGDLILLALAPQTIHLGYLKLGMIDIINRINEKIAKLTPEEIEEYKKSRAVLDESVRPKEKEKAPVPSSSLEKEDHLAPPVPQKPKAKVASESSPPSPAAAPVSAPKISEPSVSAPKAPSAVPPAEKKRVDLLSLIKKIPTTRKKEDLLKEIFDGIKVELEYQTGVEMSKILMELKDMLLEYNKTSLVVFDIARTARMLKNVKSTLKPSMIQNLRTTVDVWKGRMT